MTQIEYIFGLIGISIPTIIGQRVCASVADQSDPPTTRDICYALNNETTLSIPCTGTYAPESYLRQLKDECIETEGYEAGCPVTSIQTSGLSFSAIQSRSVYYDKANKYWMARWVLNGTVVDVSQNVFMAFRYYSTNPVQLSVRGSESMLSLNSSGLNWCTSSTVSLFADRNEVVLAINGVEGDHFAVNDIFLSYIPLLETSMPETQQLMCSDEISLTETCNLNVNDSCFCDKKEDNLNMLWLLTIPIILILLIIGYSWQLYRIEKPKKINLEPITPSGLQSSVKKHDKPRLKTPENDSRSPKATSGLKVTKTFATKEKSSPRPNHDKTVSVKLSKSGSAEMGTLDVRKSSFSTTPISPRKIQTPTSPRANRTRLIEIFNNPQLRNAFTSFLRKENAAHYFFFYQSIEIYEVSSDEKWREQEGERIIKSFVAKNAPFKVDLLQPTEIRLLKTKDFTRDLFDHAKAQVYNTMHQKYLDGFLDSIRANKPLQP